jgi:hypothetical protein
MQQLSQVHNNILKNISLPHVLALSAHHQGEHQTLLHKTVHNNTWSTVYVDLLVIMHVVICYTGSSTLTL